MDIVLEQEFIENFIAKEWRERLAYELASKKRVAGLDRFSHNAEALLNRSRLVARTAKLEKKDMESSDAIAYVLSYEYLDGKYLEYGEAVEYLLQTPSAAISLFGNTCIVKSENEGKAEYYICKK